MEEGKKKRVRRSDYTMCNQHWGMGRGRVRVRGMGKEEGEEE